MHASGYGYWSTQARRHDERWADWFEAGGRRTPMEATQIGGTVVLTSFVGIDPEAPRKLPLQFETVVYGGPLSGSAETHTSRAAAILGHRRMCDVVARAQRGVLWHVHRFLSWLMRSEP
jgi:hypothetical protein